MFSEVEGRSTRSTMEGLYLGLPLTLLVALAQTALVRDIRFLGVKPNLFLLFLVCWVLLCGAKQGLLLAMVGGIVLEVNSGAPFGSTLLALLAVVAVAGWGEVNAFHGAWFLKYLVIMGGTLAHSLVFTALLSATGRQAPLGMTLLRVVLPEVAAHLMLAAPVYGALHGITHYLDPRAVEL